MKRPGCSWSVHQLSVATSLLCVVTHSVSKAKIATDALFGISSMARQKKIFCHDDENYPWIQFMIRKHHI